VACFPEHLRQLGKMEDSEWLSELVSISLKELPAPKPKKKK
jgi:hypothetical protein